MNNISLEFRKHLPEMLRNGFELETRATRFWTARAERMSLSGLYSILDDMDQMRGMLLKGINDENKGQLCIGEFVDRKKCDEDMPKTKLEFFSLPFNSMYSETECHDRLEELLYDKVAAAQLLLWEKKIYLKSVDAEKLTKHNAFVADIEEIKPIRCSLGQKELDEINGRRNLLNNMVNYMNRKNTISITRV